MILFFFIFSTFMMATDKTWSQGNVFGQEEEQAPPIIGSVEINGNKMVSTALIKKQLRTQKEKPFSRIDINKDIKRLYELNWFSKISVDVEEGQELKVIFNVIEKPTIAHILFRGNSKIKTSSLKKKLIEKEGDLVKFSISEGDLLNEKMISDAASALRAFYEKKGFKTVQVKTELVHDEKENKADVIFHIDEGKKIKIKRIRIVGAAQLKEKKILKQMQTKRKRWYNSGVYEEEKFKEDLERIKAFYFRNGYIDIRISSVKETLVDAGKKVVIDIEVSEGSQYKLGNIEIEGQKSFSKEEILRGTLLKTGDIYLPENLSKDLKTVKDFYFSRGYIDARVDVDTFSGDRSEPILNLKYTIIENEVVFIDKIKIQGNERTKDIVIRRELNIKPGDKFDGVKMEVAQKRLSNTGLFNDDKGVPKVDLYPDPTSRDPQRDLIVEVQEGKCGELSFGAGYSSVESLIGFLELSQGNFDLFNWPSFTGDAQKLKFRTEFGQYKKEFLIDFTEPWLFEKRLLFGLQLFTTSRSYSTSDYTEDKQGFLLRLAKPVFKYTRAEVNYSFQTVEVENVGENASEYLKSQEGKREVGKLGLDLVRDVRDSFYNATKGSRLEWSIEVAGVGGNTDYYRSIFDADLYFGLWFQHVLVTSFRIGGIQEYGQSEDVPIFARFFLGGSRSIRGFDYRDIGPHDQYEEPLGGKFMYYGSFEYVIPIIEQFRLGLFFDYGNLYADFDDIDLGIMNASVGIGLQITLPIGPLRFDYGVPVITDDYHEGEGGKFTFDIGNRF